ncbi:MAG: hypothetical protein ACLVFT_01355 [Megasphaera lornae]
MTRKLRDGQERYQNNHMYGTSGTTAGGIIPPTVPTVPSNTATLTATSWWCRPPRRGAAGDGDDSVRACGAIVLLIFISWGILRIAVPFGKVTIQGNTVDDGGCLSGGRRRAPIRDQRHRRNGKRCMKICGSAQCP